jgi:dihydropyrimidinase
MTVDAHDLVIRGATLVTADGLRTEDLAIRAGRIHAIGAGAAGPAARVIAAEGRLVTPGGIDPHAHVEQRSGMGLMNADSFETAHRAALHGGTTTVMSFAAQARGQGLADAVAAYWALAERGAMADHAFHIIVCDPDVPELEEDIADLAEAGYRTLKLFTTYAIKLEDAAILRLMALARDAGMIVCVHAENDAMLSHARDALLARGLTRPKHHALAHPRLAEVEAVERICRFAEFLDAPVMLFHISTAEGVAAVRAARARGVPVGAETCPHYLFQTAAVLDCPGMEGAKWMCAPPQRTEADQAALWEGLADGTLALVSSDHAPYRFDATGKLAAGPEAPFPEIANGLPGLETRMALMFDAMVSRGRLGAEAFARVTATAAADLYGLPRKGRIAPGADADLVIWDPARRHRYGADDLHDNAGYNPWVGTEVTGWPETVLLRGQVAVEGGHLHATPGDGRMVPRPACGLRPSGRRAPELHATETGLATP